MKSWEEQNQEARQWVAPIELLEGEAAGVVVVNLVDRMLQHPPCPLGVVGVELDPVLERLDLEVALLLGAHPRRRSRPEAPTLFPKSSDGIGRRIDRSPA